MPRCLSYKGLICSSILDSVLGLGNITDTALPENVESGRHGIAGNS